VNFALRVVLAGYARLHRFVPLEQHLLHSAADVRFLS
jgi:hypothetical protein